MNATCLLPGLLLVSTMLCAQAKVDSMRQLLLQNLPDSLRGKTYVNLGIALERSHSREAMQLFRQAMRLGQEGVKGPWYSYAFIRAAGLYSAQGNRDSAAYFFEQARSYLQQHPNRKALSAYLTGWGIFHNTFGNYTEALAAYEKNGALGEAVLGKEGLAGNYLNMSNTYGRMARPAQREEYLFKALALFEETGNETGLSFCYNALGNLFYEQKEYEKADTYYQRSLALRQKRNDQRGIASIYNNLANIAMDTEQLDKALRMQLASLAINEKQLWREEVATNYINMGKIYQRMNRLSDALAAFEKAEHLLREINVTRYDAFLAAEKGRIYAQQAAHDEARKEVALRQLKASVAQARTQGDTIGQLNALSFLKDFYVQEKKYEEAYATLLQQQALTDSLEGTEVKLRISELEKKYELARKENEITVLKSQQALQAAELARQRTHQVLIALILLFVIILSIFALNRYRVLNRTKRLLEMEKMRGSIARDLHDDLGSTLSSIAIISQMGMVDTNPQQSTHLQHIHEQTSRLMESMSDIVWSINPENDTLEKLVVKMKEFAAEILEPKGFTLQFTFPAHAATLSLPAGRRKNLFLIFKEAINNAAKYSGGNRVSIDLQVEKGRLTLLIQDNGNGFNETDIRPGNGLRNMETRARQLNGTLTRTSSRTEGTHIHLQIPLT